MDTRKALQQYLRLMPTNGSDAEAALVSMREAAEAAIAAIESESSEDRRRLAETAFDSVECFFTALLGCNRDSVWEETASWAATVQTALTIEGHKATARQQKRPARYRALLLSAAMLVGALGFRTAYVAEHRPEHTRFVMAGYTVTQPLTPPPLSRVVPVTD